MDGENNGKPYEQMDDLGVPLFLETPTYESFHETSQVWDTVSNPKTRPRFCTGQTANGQDSKKRKQGDHPRVHCSIGFDPYLWYHFWPFFLTFHHS